MELDIYCDGGARGNPGPAAIGIAAEFSIFNFQFSNINNVNSNGKLKINKYIGVATNNQAEYQAVICALEWLVNNLPQFDKKPEKINFYLDSKLVVNQINGKYKIKKAHLRELVLKVRNLEGQINIPIFYNLIPREKNQEADSLVNKALDERL